MIVVLVDVVSELGIEVGMRITQKCKCLMLKDGVVCNQAIF